MNVLAPMLIGVIYVSLNSLLTEPGRRNFNAIMVAGAGAAYLSGGFGIWEFVFTGVVTFCAYKGLGSYPYIGIAWLLHTGWDVLHHLYGHPIIPFVPTSSFGCAICDPVIALWCFAGGPSIWRPSEKVERIAMDFTRILDRLYVGTCPRTNLDIELLCRYGFGAVLNLQTNEDEVHLKIDWPRLEAGYRSHRVELRRVPVRDFDSGDLATNLPQCVAALRELLDAGHTVYLHCSAGAGRSPTVAIAYLHWERGMAFDEACHYVRSLRICSPMLDASTMPQRPGT